MKRTLLFLAFLLSGITLQAQTTCAEPAMAAGSTGCVTFTYGGVAVQYTTVRAADGNIWLQQNLGSPAVATSSTDAAAYGDYFQWGRWADGHEKSTSTMGATVTPNNPLGVGASNSNLIASWWSTAGSGDAWDAATPATVTETSGCDPCRAAMGNGWRVPTEAEWAAMAQSEGITSVATAFSSNLKLALAGYRSSSNGAFTFVGTRGYYWSSTPSPTSPNLSKYLYFSSTIFNTGAGGLRAQASSVRCIKDLSAAPIPAPTSVAIMVQGGAPAAIATNDGTLQLLAAVSPANANQSVVWSITSGGEFATISGSGLVTATANGTVTVQAVSSEAPSVTNTINITITNQIILPTSVDVTVANNAAAAITTNEGTLQLNAAVLPSTADQSVIWSITAGADLATVSTGGLVSALENGTITVQAVSTADNTILDTITIVITGQITLPTSVDVTVADNAAAAITTNEGTLQLNAAILPAAADQSVTWSITAGAELAALSTGGLVSAIANGTLTVQAISTADNTLLDTIEVVITGQYVAPLSLDVTVEDNNAANIITQGGTLQLVATILPAEANQNVTWNITTGGTFATVDASGLVTAIADGIITVQAVNNDDNTILDTITVTIINQNPASAAPYCEVSVDWDVEPISLVQFAGINNATSVAVNTTPSYENFTAITGNIVTEQTYTLVVEGNTVGMFEHDIRVFIDWNQDDAFAMDTEYYHTSIQDTDGTDGTQAVVDITVPADATIGTTRLRIIKDQWNVYEDGEFDACLNAYYGQIEDYTLNVTAPVAGLDDLNKTQFTVYPNPVEDILTIQSSGEVATVEAYNLTGQLIAKGTNSQVSFGKATAGVYIVKISFADGSTATQKVIKK